MYSKLGRRITNQEFDMRIKDSNFSRVDDYINSSTPILFRCKRCYKTYSKAPKSFNSLKCSCMEREQRYLDFIKTKNISIIEPYINAKTKIKHICLNCKNTFNTTPKSVINSVIGCPSCSGKLFSTDKYKKMLPNDILLLSDEYIGSNKILTHKCTKCNFIWDTKPNYIIHLKTGCPMCKLSKGEREIYYFLDKHNIKYKHQYSVNIDGIKYRFDFYLEQLNIFIEYDGIQHFQPIDYFGGIDNYKKVVYNDSIKNEWIEKNKLKLIRISYLENINDILTNELLKKENNIYSMKYLRKFFEGKKDKFPNIKKVEIDGYFIYLGRDSKSNDHLTFNVAESDDIWMHAKGVPGSHVVIKSKDKLVTPEIIKQAALIAKNNSKGKDTENLPIVYCKRRFVKKEPGMKDGQVAVDYKNAQEVVL